MPTYEISITTIIIYAFIGIMAGIARVAINFYDLPPKDWFFMALRYSWLGLFWGVSMYFIFGSLSTEIFPYHYRFFIVSFGSVTAMEILRKFEDISSSLIVSLSDLVINILGGGKIKISTDNDNEKDE